MFVPTKYLVTVFATDAVTGQKIAVVQHVCRSKFTAQVMLTEIREIAEDLAQSGHLPGLSAEGSVLAELAASVDVPEMLKTFREPGLNQAELAELSAIFETVHAAVVAKEERKR